MTCLYNAFSKFISLACLLTVLQQTRAAQDVVTSTNSSGPGSLADAITNANARPGLDTIVFALPGPSFTINLTTPLPAIADALFIDGYSQAGAAAGPIGSRTILININGAGTGGSDAFTVNASNVTIAGLAIYSTPNYAIRIGTTVSNVHVWGNYIGTDNTGTASGLGNTGGVISNFGAFQPSVNTNIVVGTNGDGVADANEGNLVVSSTGTGANGFGIVFWLTTNSTIAGNVVGLDKDSINSAKGNSQDGILVTVESVNNTIGTDGDGVSDDVEGNMIAANGTYGINVAGLSNNNVIAGNQIGLAGNDAAAGNGLFGLQVLNSSGNRIGTDGNGTSDALERNVITSNGAGGIDIVSLDFFTDGDASDNIVAGNFIGTDATGTLVRGNNGSAIALFAGFTGFDVSNNIIGSNNDGVNDAIEGNTITNNDTGIVVRNPVATAASTGNKFSRNLIYNNDPGLGIDLGEDGVTPNDDGDADTGPNDLFNAPVILSTSIVGGNLVVTGFSRPGSVIEFYVADAGPNPNPLPPGFTKSFGEGQVFLFRGQEEGTLDGITDDSTGITGTYTGTEEGTGAGGTITETKFGFTVALASLPPGINAGTRITALAYENATGAGNTSEFGGAVPAGVLPVHLTSFRGRIHNNQAELIWTTTDEVENSHFEIERSTNGDDYTRIGTVQGRGGTNNVYQFTDNGPLSAINYYRLRQVDIDGQATYSRPLTLRKDIGAITAKITPNPFTGVINLSYKLEKEAQIRIRLVDQAGRIVRTYAMRGGAGVNTINISGLEGLSSGTYILELSGEDVHFRQQLMKR